MGLTKDQHEAYTQFFEHPTRDKFRNLLKQSIGETDYLDFKAEWPDLTEVARHILALSNSGGGAMIFGLRQDSDGSLHADGLSTFTDKADVSKTIKNYVPDSVNYNVIEFEFNGSEYGLIQGKKFQVLIVEYDQKALPLLALKEGSKLKSNVAYVREGTESLAANHQQFQKLVNTRIESGYSSSHTLELTEHLEQLKVLYQARRNKQLDALFVNEKIRDLLRPSLSEYYDFVDILIAEKRERIKKELEL